MTDNCPQCAQNNVPPLAELRTGDEISHLYRCTGCGHTWSANRDLRLYGEEAA